VSMAAMNVLYAAGCAAMLALYLVRGRRMPRWHRGQMIR